MNYLCPVHVKCEKRSYEDYTQHDARCWHLSQVETTRISLIPVLYILFVFEQLNHYVIGLFNKVASWHVWYNLTIFCRFINVFQSLRDGWSITNACKAVSAIATYNYLSGIVLAILWRITTRTLLNLIICTHQEHRNNL